MNVYGPIVFYAHEDSRGDNEWEVEQGVKVGLTPEQASEFANSRPLYEVAFEFYVDPHQGTAYCTKVDIGDGEPFIRSAPGQQLELFETEANARKYR